MVCFKANKILFILVCLIILIIPFALVTNVVNASYEEIDFSTVNNLVVSDTSDVFSYHNFRSVYYVPMEKGYKYLVNFNGDYTDTGVTYIRIVSCSEVPAVGVSFQILFSVNLTDDKQTSFEYFNYSDNTYIVISPSGSAPANPATYISFSRDVVNGQSSAVDGLVNNVGIDNLWNIFDVSVDFIKVVIIVALGVFIIFILIRKISKGKSGNF